jgi:hypothetical protein
LRGALIRLGNSASGECVDVTNQPMLDQSGQTDVTGRISKIGDGEVRTALYGPPMSF